MGTYSRMYPSGASCAFDTVSCATGPMAAFAATAKDTAERKEWDIIVRELETANEDPGYSSLAGEAFYTRTAADVVPVSFPARHRE